jgi:DNA-binding LacI/PurR family transcriptional regulator
MTILRKVTIRDVARVAAVSTTTVSDAINRRGRLSDSTREHVIAVAAQLGYSANPLAKNLRQGRSGAVGLYFPQNSLHLQYYVDLAIGAAEEALAQQYALVLLPASFVDMTMPIQLDGVVIADPAIGDDMVDRLHRLGVPIVTCEPDLSPERRITGVVASDHHSAMTRLLEHLTSSGAKRIAVVCPTDATSFARDVRNSYLEWTSRTSSPVILVEVPLLSTAEDIASAVERILALVPTVDAIVSVADGTAPHVIRSLRAAGLSVPDDIRVASYVDGPELATLATPVTAVDLAARKMGRMASLLLADIIAGRAAKETRRVLSTTLNLRASTGP